MTLKLFSFSRNVAVAAGLAFSVIPMTAFAQAVPSTTTVPASGITETDATLNGLNGDVDATGHSFWVSTSTFSTAIPVMPDGVYSTPVLAGGAATTTFSALLSSVTTDGVPSNMPAVTPSTTYYFAAWSEVGGTWYPGEVLNFTTSPTPGPVAHPDSYVDAVSGNDSNDCLTTSTACQTITAALAHVDENGTIHVAAGTYAEPVMVTKSVTLRGAQEGVDANSCAVASGSESIVGSATGAFVVQANNVTIDGFTITGVSSDWNAGVHIGGTYASTTVQNNIIRDNVMGIYLNGSNGLVTQNCIKNNNVAGSASGNGIYSDQGLATATISHNTFTGAHTNSSIILVSDASSNIIITENALTDDDEILLTNVNGGTISGNTITNSLYHGIQLAGGNTGITITDNTISGNSTFATASAIRVNGGSMNTNVAISNNSLIGNNYGINVTASDATNVTAHFNDLSGNLVSLYYGSSPTPLSATNNWWGCATSPATSTDEIAFPTSSATCGLITEDSPTGVTFNPWLASLSLSGNNPVSSQIHNSDGVAVGGDTGLKVSFTSTGVNPAGMSTTTIGSNNTATYGIDAAGGSNAGDTTIAGDVLFADQSSTLASTLVINAPGSETSSGGGHGGGGSRSVPLGSTTQLVGCALGSGDLFDVTNGRPCAIFAPGQVLGASVFKFLINLRIGMQNNDVMELQKRFRAEGFFTYPTDTGYFGPITFASAKAYQAAHPTIGYITGFVGPLTRAVLNQ